MASLAVVLTPAIAVSLLSLCLVKCPHHCVSAHADSFSLLPQLLLFAAVGALTSPSLKPKPYFLGAVSQSLLMS